MAIAPSDIAYRLSGGATNAVQAASLGGVKSSNVATAGIFDDVSAAEALAGDIEYRCVYVHNSHGTLTLGNAVAWLASNTPSATTSAEIGLGTSAVSGTEQTVADENTAPTGITFVGAANKAGGIAVGDLAPGQHRAIWVRRIISAGTAAAADGFTVRVEGETAP